MAHILDGKAVANKIKEQLKERIAKFKSPPRLSVLLVGDDPASKVYVEGKHKACASVGIASDITFFPSHVEHDCIFKWIRKQVYASGVLVQLPLPAKFDRNLIIQHLDPLKDVDCFHPENRGLLDIGDPRFLPCTPAGILEILKYHGIPVKGANVVIVNRSIVVGQPLATMLTQNTEWGNATVTLCHEHTKDIADVCRGADIIVTAVGKRPDFILTADMVKSGAVVIDVGINRPREGNKIVGDADYPEVSKKASFITPVPGGVGPCTVAMLLKNTVDAYERLQ